MDRTHLLTSVICICGFLALPAAWGDSDCLRGGSRITDIRFGYLNSPPKGSLSRGCLWTLKVSEGQIMELNFTYLDLPADQLCQFAYLEIWTSSNQVLRYCGDQAPPAMTFTGPQLVYVDYYTSRTVKQTSEFRLRYKEVDVPRLCSSDQVSCQNKICVSRTLSCDKKDDCGDGTDEEGCGHQMESPKSCGKPAVTPILGNDYIVGGREAISGSWPWQVSLQKKDVYPSGHFCGGSLINNLWVVTAAHCFLRRNATVVRVRLGDHNTFRQEDGELTRYAEKVIPHPNYNADLDMNDIALLKLKAPVSFSKTVSPICLPKTGQELETDTMLHVTGWGETFVDGSAAKLRQVKLPLIDWNRCNQSYLGTVAPNTLCTAYPDGGYAPCNGDSGGPMTGQSESDLWTLYGLVSWGHKMCGTARGPSVFTKVSAFVPWIQSVLSNN